MVIVDGNNVMGQRVGWHRDKPAAQKRLIDEVERFALWQEEPHILVFDAGSIATAAENRSGSPLAIQYARRGSSADELILELVYRHSRLSSVSVVTSDRALARQVQALGAKVMRSGAFRRMLEQQSSR